MGIPQGKSIRPADTDSWSPALPEAAGFEHFVVDTPGLHTHVATIGDGEPVVLLHGFPQHWWQWHKIAPTIAAQGFQVFVPDLRGAGWTVADDPYVERQTRMCDVLAIFDALNFASAHLISHDMGAITAIQLSYEHPQRVRSAIQLAVFPAFAKFHPRLAPAFQHLPGLIWHRSGASLRKTFSSRYMTHPLSDELAAAHLAPLQRPAIDAAVRPLVRKMILREALRIARGAYRRQRLTVPTLVVYGRQDYPTTEALMKKVCPHPEQYADHIEFAYVDDAAHFITDDAPEAIAQLAVEWLHQRTKKPEAA